MSVAPLRKCYECHWAPMRFESRWLISVLGVDSVFVCLSCLDKNMAKLAISMDYDDGDYGDNRA